MGLVVRLVCYLGGRCLKHDKEMTPGRERMFDKFRPNLLWFKHVIVTTLHPTRGALLRQVAHSALLLQLELGTAGFDASHSN